LIPTQRGPGKSKEQALAANNHHVRRIREREKPAITGFDVQRRTVMTSGVELTSRGSLVRVQYRPSFGKTRKARPLIALGLSGGRYVLRVARVLMSPALGSGQPWRARSPAASVELHGGSRSEFADGLMAGVSFHSPSTDESAGLRGSTSPS
jgi:hypothetical protein